MRFTLVGVPEGARVTVDGRQVEGLTFELPRSRGAAELAVEAAGHRPWQERLDLAEATTTETNSVRVELERDARPAGAPPRRQPRAAPPPASQRSGVQPIVGDFGGIP